MGHDALQPSYFFVYTTRKWVIEELNHAGESCSFYVMKILPFEGMTAELVTGLFETEPLLAEK